MRASVEKWFFKKQPSITVHGSKKDLEMISSLI